MEQPRKIIRLPFPSIRIQLLLISLVVLVLPWLGVQNIREIEKLLREQQVINLASVAETAIKGLGPAYTDLQHHHENISASDQGSEIIVSTLPDSLMIDGYRDDWPDDIAKQTFSASNALLAGQTDTSIEFDLIAGKTLNSLLLLIDVRDDLLYQSNNPFQSPDNGDHVLLGIDETTYIISSNTPGWLSVTPVNESTKQEVRIQAELQVNSKGYVIEIAIPLNMIGNRLSLALIDRDNENKDHMAVIGNHLPSTHSESGYLFSRLDDVKRQLQAYASNDKQFVVTDVRRNILAETSAIIFEQNHYGKISSILDRLIQLILLADAPVETKTQHDYRLSGDYLLQILKQQASHVFTVDDQGNGLLTLAVPLLSDKQTIGALVIRQSTRAISQLRHQALFKILITTLVAMAIVMLVFLFYAGFLVSRIRRINAQLHHTVSEDGRLQSNLQKSRLKDEIGELNEGLVDIVARLQEYQRYMESLASKLSHELRTPLTVVQSSLENLQNETDQGQQQTLLQRANDGLSRLKLILTNLTEASRLESSLKATDPESFDLVKVIASCMAGYQQAYPDYEFIFDCDIEAHVMQGSPELMAQLLDKLVSNAIDFHTADTAINISITKTSKSCVLAVENQGMPLPEQLKSTLFDSMISQRQTYDEQPHLGLGLYIVRLIADYHSAKASAENTKTGVSFKVTF